MSTIRCYDSNGAIIGELYQWDKNVRVTISGIDVTNVSELHFCNRRSETAIRVAATKSGNSITANIPNILLCEPESIIIFICEALSNNETRTTHVCRISIHPRPKASSSYYDNDQGSDGEGSDSPSTPGSDGGVVILDGTVRYDFVQTLSEEQKEIARSNIGAVSRNDSMTVSVYDPRGMRTDIFKYVDEKLAGCSGSSGETTAKPKVTAIEVEKTDGTLAITYSFDSGTTRSDTFSLDNNGRPVGININGVYATITLTGFDDNEVSSE